MPVATHGHFASLKENMQEISELVMGCYIYPKLSKCTFKSTDLF
jgi:hypothetical protein